MKSKTTYPPLTKDDILTLRGRPMSERIEPSHVPVEEWIYYNIKAKTKECYLFKNERLVSYNKKEANQYE